jgi:hypothetical protein
MSKQLRSILALTAGTALAAYAGGFWISIQNPSTLKDAAAKNAVVLVRADGCHNPAEANITATAEGLVNGVRRSIPLKLEPVSQPATFAITRQWPAEGVWVLNLTGTYLGRDAGALVRITPGKFEKESARLFQRKVTAAEIDAALRSAQAQVAMTAAPRT